MVQQENPEGVMLESVPSEYVVNEYWETNSRDKE